jgi:hypothetical protein
VEENMIYSFLYSVENISDRFLLHFDNPVNISDNTGSGGLSIYSHNNKVYIQKPAGFDGTIFVYDILGQEILNTKAVGEGLMSIPVTNGMGYYLVKVKSAMGLTTEKVLIR